EDLHENDCTLQCSQKADAETDSEHYPARPPSGLDVQRRLLVGARISPSPMPTPNPCPIPLPNRSSERVQRSGDQSFRAPDNGCRACQIAINRNDACRVSPSLQTPLARGAR